MRNITQFSSHSSSFFAGYFLKYLWTSLLNIVNLLIEIITVLAMYVVKFLMTVMDALEYIAYSFLGINFGVNDFSKLSEYIHLDELMEVFRAVAVLAVVLMLIFTIFAIIKQEWDNAHSGFTKTSQGEDGKTIYNETNPKTPFISTAIKNIIMIIIMPLIIYLVFAGTTSILNSFNLAIKQNQNSTISSQIFSSSTYEANKYRIYANNGQRIPIIIKAYDDSEANYDNIDDMAIKIESVEVQQILKGIATNIVNKTFDTFDKSIVSKNNQHYNTTEYSNLYEQFICTPEQYQVMADFVDYAQESGLTYYIKSVDDKSIDWKYVSSAVYSQSTNELTIKYINSNVVNNGYVASAAGSSITDEEYTMIYTPNADVTTPISDALKSIMAMLGIGDFEDNRYNVMDREEGFTNLVTWSNEKAFLKLSDNVNIDDLSIRTNWTTTDEILIYEYYRWKYNNCFRDYSLQDLKDGIEWDVKLITYQEYYDIIDAYSGDKYYYAVCLNNNYYLVEKSETETDNLGNPYYFLIKEEDLKTSNDEVVKFLDQKYSTVEETGLNFTFKLSNGFNINNVTSWSKQDQILIYEYFKDETYRNPLRKYNFNDFLNSGSGASLPIYKITNYSAPGVAKETVYCVYLNDTYYKLNSSKTAIDVSGGDLLKNIVNGQVELFYKIILGEKRTLTTKDYNRYGLPTSDFSGLLKTTTQAVADLNLENSQDKKYENYQLKLSSKFSMTDMTTWSFRDIYLLYIHSNGYGYDTTYLKNYGLKGEVGKLNGKYVYKIEETQSSSTTTTKYIEIDTFNKISTECVYSLKLEETLNDNVFTKQNQDIFIEYLETSDILTSNLNAGAYNFAFSYKFKDGDVSTYTIGDLVLMYAQSLGLVGSFSNLKSDGYNALIYKVGGRTYYQFGKNIDESYFLCINDLSDFMRGDEPLIDKFWNSPVSRLGITNEQIENIEDNYDDLCSRFFAPKGTVAISPYTTSSTSGESVTLKFSNNFEASNYNTWTSSDFILYYIITTAYDDAMKKGTETIQNFINNDISVYKYRYIFRDSIGDSVVEDAYMFEYKIEQVGSNGVAQEIDKSIVINAEVFDYLKQKNLANHHIQDSGLVSYSVKAGSHGALPTKSFEVSVFTESGMASFITTDYYYYDTKSTSAYEILYKNLTNIDPEWVTLIENLDPEAVISSINLKINVGFNKPTEAQVKAFLKDTSKWTVLDYIVLKEYSSNVKNNCFEGMTLLDVCTLDNTYNIYCINSTNESEDIVTNCILEINDNYYNVTEYVGKSGNEYLANSDDVIAGCFKYSTPGSYSLKVPYENLSFAVNPQVKYVIPNQDEFTIAYQTLVTEPKKTVMLTPHFGTKIAYQVNIDSLDRYTITDKMLEVSWPRKLMNDMLVMYPDLNWQTLIATGDWKDVLGDYYSAYSNGAFSSYGNSSNITAVGMILSEFFLSCAEKSILDYADYEYSSLFDEDVIKALMLSTLGDDDYYQLKQQAEIFVELFNTTFASILDDIAYDEQINISEGTSNNLSIFVYKAFMSTQLLGSDLGEYLYTVANRVYAQYTIYESLASAAGHYDEYEKYMNGETSSIILKIGTEYYDITSYVVMIDEQERLEFKNNFSSALPEILNEERRKNGEGTFTETEQAYKDRITAFEKFLSQSETFSFLIKKGLNGALDKIIERELSNDDVSYNELSDYVALLEADGDGVLANIYVSSDKVAIEINNNYYDITSEATYKGSYKITKPASEVDGNGVAFPTTYAQNYVQEQVYGDSFIWVQKTSGTLTVLDKIISYYIDLNHKAGGTDARIESMLNNGEGLMCEIFTVRDENAFTFSTFQDLVLYENKQLINLKNPEGSAEKYTTNLNVTPMFTFNMRRVLNILLEKSEKSPISDTNWLKIINGKDEEFKLGDVSEFFPSGSVVEEYISGGYLNTMFAESSILFIRLESVSIWEAAFIVTSEYIKDHYKNEYLQKESRVYDNDKLYCYLYEVYYAIKLDLQKKDSGDPVYLEVYEEYLSGDIVRWNILAKENISSSTQFIPEISSYKSDKSSAQVKALLRLFQLYLPNYTLTIDEYNAVSENMGTVSGGDSDSISAITWNNDSTIGDLEIEKSHYHTLVEKSISNSTSSSLKEDYENVFGLFNTIDLDDDDSLIGKVLKFLNVDAAINTISVSLTMTGLFVMSSSGDYDAWLTLLKMNNSINNLINEMSEIIELYRYAEPSKINEITTESGSKVVKDNNDNYYSLETYEETYQRLIDFSVALDDYINAQETLDTAYKSCITFTLAQYGKEYVMAYEFNIENRTYTLNNNASPLRIAEYVLGGAFLADYGIQSAFTPSDFEGFVHATKIYNPELGMLQTRLEMWPELREFAGEIAAFTARVYYNSNLKDLASEVKNGVYITDILYNSGQETNIEYLILKYLASCDTSEDPLISAQTLCTLICEVVSLDGVEFENLMLKLDKIKGLADGETLSEEDKITKSDLTTLISSLNGDYNKIHLAFKQIMSYLLLSEDQQKTGSEDDINFENMTFTDLKINIIQCLSDYESNPSESAEENVDRYLTLLYLASSQIDYSVAGNKLGTNLLPIKVSRNTVEVRAYANQAVEFDKISHIDYGSSAVEGKFIVDESTKNVILDLANCENSPVEDVVKMEYENIYKRTDGVYDENLGDIFVVCHYDQETSKFIPFLAKNFYTSVVGSGYSDYINTYHHLITTNYYANNGTAYPIIAKGILTADGLPTAIRIVDGEVQYYRTSISTVSDVNESAITNTHTSAEVSTVGYTKYVPQQFLLPFGDSNKMVQFIGNANIESVITSDISVFFMQSDKLYIQNSENDMGGIVVLENIAYHYSIGTQSLMLLFIGFLVLFPLILRLSVSAMRRILDLMYLGLSFPLMAALSVMKSGGKGENPVQSWTTRLIQTLFSVFGLVLGINAYFLLVEVTMNINFVNVSTFNNIKQIGGFDFISLTSINLLIRYVFLIEAVAMIKSVMTLLTPIITGGKVTAALNSAVGGEDPVKQVKDLTSDVKKMANATLDVINGDAIIKAKDAMIESFMSNVPGGKLVGGIVEEVKDKASMAKARGIRNMAEKAGVSEGAAQKFEQSYVKNSRQQRQKKRESRVNNANSFMSNYAQGFNFNFNKPDTLMTAKHREKRLKKFTKSKSKKQK